MKEELVDHFNENGFVIAQNLLDFSEIKHYKNVIVNITDR